MCGPIAMGIMAAAAVVGTGASIIQGSNAASQQRKAEQQAETTAAQTQAANERAVNQANQKQPDISSILQKNAAGNSGGVGSTMLTGPMGSAMNPSMLGRATLLGS